MIFLWIPFHPSTADWLFLCFPPPHGMIKMRWRIMYDSLEFQYTKLEAYSAIEEQQAYPSCFHPQNVTRQRCWDKVKNWRKKHIKHDSPKIRTGRKIQSHSQVEVPAEFGKRLFYESDLNGERIIERKKLKANRCKGRARERGAEWNPEKECLPPHRAHIFDIPSEITLFIARALVRLGVKHTYIYVARRERRNISFISACSSASSSSRIIMLWSCFEFQVQREAWTLFCFFLFLIKSNIW